jgi:hypothetical protein
MKRVRIPIPRKATEATNPPVASTGWDHYWKHFDQLLEILITDNKIDLVAALRDAQLYVNGFTDGWHQFLAALDKIIAEHYARINSEQQKSLSYLAESLRQSLGIR